MKKSIFILLVYAITYFIFVGVSLIFRGAEHDAVVGTMIILMGGCLLYLAADAVVPDKQREERYIDADEDI